VGRRPFGRRRLGSMLPRLRRLVLVGGSDVVLCSGTLGFDQALDITDRPLCSYGERSRGFRRCCRHAPVW